MGRSVVDCVVRVYGVNKCKLWCPTQYEGESLQHPTPSDSSLQASRIEGV